jgi:hypothetical protein
MNDQVRVNGIEDFCGNSDTYERDATFNRETTLRADSRAPLISFLKATYRGRHGSWICRRISMDFPIGYCKCEIRFDAR